MENYVGLEFYNDRSTVPGFGMDTSRLLNQWARPEPHQYTGPTANILGPDLYMPKVPTSGMVQPRKGLVSCFFFLVE